MLQQKDASIKNNWKFGRIRRGLISSQNDGEYHNLIDKGITENIIQNDGGIVTAIMKVATQTFQKHITRNEGNYANSDYLTYLLSHLLAIISVGIKTNHLP